MPTFSAVTFRTIGAAATAQNLFSLYNGSTDRVVRIRKLVVQMDATAVLTAVSPLFKTSKIAAAPGAGVALTKVAFDTGAEASNSDIVAKGACSADGGSLTAITGTLGDNIWEAFLMRLHTAVGQVLAPEIPALPTCPKEMDFVLRPGKGLVVNIVAAAAASNPATNHYVVSCLWDEDRQ